MAAKIQLREGYILPIREGDVLNWNAAEVSWCNSKGNSKSFDWAELIPGNRLHMVTEIWHGEEKLLERRLFSGGCFNRFQQFADLRPFQKRFGSDARFTVKASLYGYNEDGFFENGKYSNGILMAHAEKEFVPWSRPAKLEKRIELEYLPGLNSEHPRQGNYFPRFGDVDNDGRYEIFFSQGTTGQMMYDMDGKLLWEWRCENGAYEEMRQDSDCAIYDIDNDGFAEVICARKLDGKIRICIVDGRTGELKRSVEWPKYLERLEGGHRSSLRIADLRGIGRPSDIVASEDYVHMTAFDDQLNELWDFDPESQVEYPGNWFANLHGYPYKLGLGHAPQFCDIDRDGREEILWGATLLDSTGKILWSRNDLRMVGNREDEHIDCPRFVDINDDGDLKIYFSSGGYLLDLKGNVLLSLEEKGCKIMHGQRAAIARVDPDSDEKRLLQMDFHHADFGCCLMIFDLKGNLLEHFPIDRSFQVGNWDGAAAKRIFLADKKNNRTRIIDGRGNTLCTIPAKMYLWESVVADVCGDSRDKFVTPVVTEDGRAFLEFYSCAAPSRNPEDNSQPLRKNSAKFWNWTAF